MIVIDEVDTTRDKKILAGDSQAAINDGALATSVRDIYGPGEGNNTSLDLKEIDDDELYDEEDDEQGFN